MGEQFEEPGSPSREEHRLCTVVLGCAYGLYSSIYFKSSQGALLESREQRIRGATSPHTVFWKAVVFDTRCLFSNLVLPIDGDTKRGFSNTMTTTKFSSSTQASLFRIISYKVPISSFGMLDKTCICMCVSTLITIRSNLPRQIRTHPPIHSFSFRFGFSQVSL